MLRGGIGEVEKKVISKKWCPRALNVGGLEGVVGVSNCDGIQKKK